MNPDSKKLQESLNEQKIGQMAQTALTEVFEKYHPNNAEMVVFACVVGRMMVERALESRTDYPKKMSVECPSGHVVELSVRPPTTKSLDVAKQLIHNH